MSYDHGGYSRWRKAGSALRQRAALALVAIGVPLALVGLLLLVFARSDVVGTLMLVVGLLMAVRGAHVVAWTLARRK